MHPLLRLFDFVSRTQVINFGRVGRSMRAAPKSQAQAPPNSMETHRDHDHDHDDNGSLAGGSIGPGESLSSQSTTFLEPSRSGGGAKKSMLSSLTSPSRRRGNKASASLSAAAAPLPSKAKAKAAGAAAAVSNKGAKASSKGVVAVEEPQTPLSPAGSSTTVSAAAAPPAGVKYQAGAVFNAAAVEKNRKRILFYLERWEVDDDYSHALAFGQHALANHRRHREKGREEGRGRDEDEDDDVEGIDITLESMSLTLPPIQKQQQQQQKPRLASWKRSEWNREAMNGR
jgi:hypothetical protein